jgi:hypothetical protein
MISELSCCWQERKIEINPVDRMGGTPLEVIEPIDTTSNVIEKFEGLNLLETVL